MERLLISLTPEMRMWLKQQAAQQGISMAAVVRTLIHKEIQQEAKD